MNRITTIVSARFSNLVARRIPALGRTATARQVEKYRSSGGRKGNKIVGQPVFLLDVVGRSSGERRPVMLMYVPRGDDLVVIGSAGGSPTTPNWYKNLMAAGGAEVQVGSDLWSVVARELETGPEHDECWSLATAVYPGFDSYQRFTDRRIPVAVLERRDDFAAAFAEATTTDPRLGAVAAVLLYRTLGVTLPHGAAAAASLWPMAIRCAQVNPDGVARAGFGSAPDAGDRLFDAIVDSPSGVVFTDNTWEETWRRIKTDDGLVHVEIPELLVELAELASETPPGDDPEWPLLLSAGERRSFTANTILRDPAWRKKDLDGALRVSPADAERIGLASGDVAKLSTKRSHAVVTVAVDDTVQSGHISLPNGFGLDHVEGGARTKTGVGTNEFTASEDRDPWAGTPWHKTTPARLEPV